MPSILVPKTKETPFLQEVTAKARAAAEARKQPAKLDPVLGADAALAEAKRERCRADIGEYGNFVFGFSPTPHHRIWIDLIQQLLRDELVNPETGFIAKKLLILAPPGTAKSHWVSTVLPAWYLGNHPDHQVLFLTSSDHNAKNFSGTIRAALEDSKKHEAVFSDPACRPMKRRGWSGDGYFLQGLPLANKDPNYRAGGYDARIIGARCDLFILDDPLDEKSSRSVLDQAAAKDYYENTLKTRPRPTTGHTVAIMTRWHENDFADHLLASSDWYAVRCPMIAEDPIEDPTELQDRAKRKLPDPTLTSNGGYREPGDYLWPDYFTPQQVEDERTGGHARFSLVFQCSVVGQGGDIFASEAWFLPLPHNFYDPGEDGRTPRDNLTLYLGWDTAFSSKDLACESVGLVVGFDRMLRGYVLGLWHDKVGQAGLEDAMVEMILQWKPAVMLVEDAAFRTSIIKEVLRRVLGRCHVNVKLVRAVGDKELRAALPAGRAEHGFLYVDRSATWWTTFRDQCLAFPNTRLKDIVDALSLVFQYRFAPENLVTKKKQIARINPNASRSKRNRMGRIRSR